MPYIVRLNDEEYEQAVSWAKTPRFLRRWEPGQAGHPFVLGKVIDSESDAKSHVRSFQTARERAAALYEVITEDDYDHALLRGKPMQHPRGQENRSEENMNFLHDTPLSELEEIVRRVSSGDFPIVLGYRVTSLTPVVPFNDSEFVPIYCSKNGSENPDDMPGAILRYEGDVKVLVPIDPHGNGRNSKLAVTRNTKGWEVQQSIMYVDNTNIRLRKEVEEVGYY